MRPSSLLSVTREVTGKCDVVGRCAGSPRKPLVIGKNLPGRVGLDASPIEQITPSRAMSRAMNLHVPPLERIIVSKPAITDPRIWRNFPRWKRPWRRGRSR